MPIPINLATEDRLSEAVLRRMLDHVDRGFFVGTAYGRSGFGYLKKTIHGWNNAAKGTPFLVLTDLDELPCVGELIGSWLGSSQHPNLILRVAVKEVESWLLADPQNLSAYLSIRSAWIPHDPDNLPDPKLALVQLAARSRSSAVRDRLVPKAGSTAQQGRDHNSLSDFVKNGWNLNTARMHSPSLNRSLARLETFNPTWE